MSGFSADWLDLREPLDACSRSAALVARLRAEAPGDTRRIVDLATGTGANLRYLAPRLGGEQEWLLADKDGTLLEFAEERLRLWAAENELTFRRWGETLSLRGPDLRCRVYRQEIDLARDALHLDLENRWLVTASALLDLVAQRWLDKMLRRCRSAGARLLFALTYDGVANFSPSLVDDALVNQLINLHQARDKGFGPALGPRAALDAPATFRRCGYDVAEVCTPWQIGRTQAALQRALVDDWAKAAVVVAPAEAERIGRWRRRRHDFIAAGTSSLRVGHRDLLAWPGAVPQTGGISNS